MSDCIREQKEKKNKKSTTAITTKTRSCKEEEIKKNCFYNTANDVLLGSFLAYNGGMNKCFV